MKIFTLLILLSINVLANIGQITALKGFATIMRDSKSLNATVGFKLEEKDVLNTKKRSKLQIIFKDGTIVTVGRSSTFKIAEYLYDDVKSAKSKVNFGFLKGSFKSITGKIGKIAPEKFKLRTKTATIGIRGTTVVGNQSRVACTYGKISVTSHGVSQIVPAGMFTHTPPNAPPTPPKVYVAGSLGEADVEDTGNVQEKSNEKSEDKETSQSEEEQRTDNQVNNGEGEEKQTNENPPDTPQENSPTENEATADDYSSMNDIEGSNGDATTSEIGTVLLVETNTDQNQNLETQSITDIQETGNEVQETVQDEVKTGIEENTVQEATDAETPTETPTETPIETEKSVTDIASQTTTSNLNSLTSGTSGLTKKSTYSDSYLEYGYWEDATGIATSTYVSGVVTSSDYIDQMIGNIANNATYSGGMSAIVTNPDGTKVSSSGTVNIAMDFVNKNFNGTANVTQGNFKANIAGNIHKYGFDSTSVSAASGDTAGVTSGNLNGKFYGSTAQTAGGTFNLTSSNAGSASGSFGLTKQQQ